MRAGRRRAVYEIFRRRQDMRSLVLPKGIVDQALRQKWSMVRDTIYELLPQVRLSPCEHPALTATVKGRLASSSSLAMEYDNGDVLFDSARLSLGNTGYFEAPYHNLNVL